MIIFIIFIIIAIISTTVCYKAYKINNADIYFCSVTSVVLSIFLVACMIVCVIANNIDAIGKVKEKEQIYQFLTYQLENNIYDNDISKKMLYDQIQEWNADVAAGKARQRNIWTGIFYPNIYDNFELIPLE